MLYLYIFVGGGLGSLARYAISITNPFKFYYATFAVNFIGCFFIGLCAAQLKAGNIKTALIAGVLGGFTTFSAFGLDFLKLVEKQNYQEAIFYVALTMVLSLIAVFLAYSIGK